MYHRGSSRVFFPTVPYASSERFRTQVNRREEPMFGTVANVRGLFYAVSVMCARAIAAFRSLDAARSIVDAV